jgi:transglutaminase-like putative cysteine protease
VISYRVRHTTEYRYSQPVSLCHNETHLLPRELPYQHCFSGQLQIHPAPTARHDREDFFGNRVTYFIIQESHAALEVTATSEVHLLPVVLPDFSATPVWEEAKTRLHGDHSREGLEARQFMLDSPFVSASAQFAAYAAPSFSRGRPLLEAVHALMTRIHSEFVYDPEFTTIATPLSTVFEHRRGVCQDFAHLALACLRSLGFAARYVSGYLETFPPPDQPHSANAAASHAWLSVYSPGHGWVDFDPTNDQIPTDRHITVAWGRDYGDVTPLKGTLLGGGTHVLHVDVEVKRRTDRDSTGKDL